MWRYLRIFSTWRIQRIYYFNLSKKFSAMQDSTPRKYKIFITTRIPNTALDLLRENGGNLDIRMRDSTEPISHEELLNQVVGIDVLYCFRSDTIDKTVIENAGPNLKIISTITAGTDHIDLATCKKLSIQVSNVPGVLTNACADFAIGLLLSVSRRIAEAVARAKSGDWPPWHPMWMCGPSLHGSTVGIVGLGQIGQAVARRLKGFGVERILYTATTRKSEIEKELGNVEKSDFHTLLSSSDFILVLCSLNAATKGLFDKDAFSRMKQNCILVNASRGLVLNQEELYTALVEKRILAAGIDVSTPEPLPPSHPLFQLDNCVITPHIASAEFKCRNEQLTLAARNILSWINEGQLITPVDF